MNTPVISIAITLAARLPSDVALTVAAMAGRLGFSAVHLEEGADPELLEQLIAAADPAAVVTDVEGDTPGIVRRNDPAAVAAARAELDARGANRPLLVAVPISIGRTRNEAVARADLEPRFATGPHPRDLGIFGTFEEAQQQVQALVRAGADGLLLDVPLERDVADVLAQIRALVVGPTAHLVNGDYSSMIVPPPRTVFYGS